MTDIARGIIVAEEAAYGGRDRVSLVTHDVLTDTRTLPTAATESRDRIVLEVAHALVTRGIDPADLAALLGDTAEGLDAIATDEPLALSRWREKRRRRACSRQREELQPA